MAAHRPPSHPVSAVELKALLEAERRGTPFLLYRDAEGAQRLHALEEEGSDRLSVGRAPETGLCIAWDTEVSRLHAELERVAGQWMLVDDGLSRNGTFVNNERLHGRRRLHDGDALRLGETPLTFRDPQQAPTQATVASNGLGEAIRLTDAQRRVLLALCRPFKDATAFAAPATNQQIAEELFLSVDAVKTHLRGLFGRFGVEDLPQMQKRLALVERAFALGIVTEHDL